MSKLCAPRPCPPSACPPSARFPSSTRLALASLATLAAALLLPFSASAAPAPRTVAGDICDYASNKPPQLRNEIRNLLQAAGFIGLPSDACDKFVNSLVKSCLQLVKAGTRCSLDVNATVGLNAGKMTEIGCDAEPDKDDQKSCKSTAKSNTKSNDAVASQTVQQLGVVACNGDFAATMLELCLDGVPTP